MPPSPPSHAESAVAARWLEIARALAASAGMERSARFSPNGLDDSRYLVTLSGQPWLGSNALDGFLAEMRFPAASSAELAKALARARFVHLGYEKRDGAPLLKLYCEFPLAGQGRAHVHRAFKWMPSGADAAACDDYWLHPPMTVDVVQAQLAGVAPPELVAALEPLLAKAAPRMDEGFMVLDVDREGIRRSCDVRLYDAELKVSDAADAIAAAAKLLGCGAVGWLKNHGDAPLGHISAGRMGQGNAFLTVYHGGRPL